MNAQILYAPRTRSIRVEWLVYTMIAVVGSLFYGASLATSSDLAGSGSYAAIALAASAGAGWVFFGISCLFILRPRLGDFVHACLVTMVIGEGVLAVGAVLNFSGLAGTVAFNVLWVALSNITMLVILARQLLKIRIPVPVTVTLWMLFLNGSGVLIFALFYPNILT